jgi:NADH:ubiquinone oxidoreductase subunit F (NADH-binding)
MSATTAAAGLPRLLAGLTPDAPMTLEQHLAAHGPLPLLVDPEQLISEVARAGLHGRGGAGFPMARKLQAVADGRSAVVIANGAEGEPASAKDRVLLERAPHLVLDGVELAVQTVGAEEAIVCVPEGSSAQRTIADALAERPRTRRKDGSISIEPIPARYVAGEETALVQHLGGGPALPTVTPPRPFERGVRGRPTLIQNVETLAQLALLARHDAGWFRAIGTDTEPGSMLITLLGGVARPAVYEIAIGMPLGQLIELAGGATDAVSAVLVGGYFGAWIPGEFAHDLTLDRASLGAAGGSLGCGIVAVLPQRSCGVAETARVIDYLARESAGQCGPCVFGLAAIADGVAQLARGQARGRAGSETKATLQRWTMEIAGRGACRHPDGAGRFLRSALAVFAQELDDHAHHGACDACGDAPILPTPRELARALR